MTSDTRRAELTAEIAELQQEHLQSFLTARLYGWIPAIAEAHDQRAERLAVLRRELNILDPSPES